MDGKSGYSDCELRYIDQGYELEYTAEACASAEGGASDQETEKSNEGGKIDPIRDP